MQGIGKYARTLPPVHVLLAGRSIAHQVGDRHGLQLFNCAIDAPPPEVGE